MPGRHLVLDAAAALPWPFRSWTPIAKARHRLSRRARKRRTPTSSMPPPWRSSASRARNEDRRYWAGSRRALHGRLRPPPHGNTRDHPRLQILLALEALVVRLHAPPILAYQGPLRRIRVLPRCGGCRGHARGLRIRPRNPRPDRFRPSLFEATGARRAERGAGPTWYFDEPMDAAAFLEGELRPETSS